MKSMRGSVCRKGQFGLPGGSVRAGILAVALALAAAQAAGKVTVLQQGVSPSPDYAGCVDTFIVSSGWAHDQPINRPRSPDLSIHGRNGALMRFDLAPIGKDQAVRKAILRLYPEATPPWEQGVEVYALARDWEASATWYEYAYKDAAKSDENNWTKPGGDLDETDYGKGKPGLVDKAVCRGGPFGHVVELDVTAIVAAWAGGKKSNFGLLIATDRGGVSVASADWPIPAYRPALVVEHYGPSEQPAGEVRLTLPEAAGPKPKMSALAGAAQAPGPAEVPGLGTLRFGRNSNCQYRIGHRCGYAKQDPRYPGNWGWTPRLRVGGTAGDLNHAVFYFDLAPIGKNAAVRRATLRVFVDVGNMRLPEDTLGQDKVARPIPSTAPGSPTAEQLLARQEQDMVQRVRSRMGQLAPYSFGVFLLKAPIGAQWTEGEFTFTAPKSGERWSAKDGTLVDATDPEPVAVANVGEQWKALLAARDSKMPETWVEFDVTKLVGAWASAVAPNIGLVLDNRLMGGEMVLFADDWIEPDRRPYLEVEVSPAPMVKGDGDFKPEPLLPEGEYWVEPMKKAHARWKGTPGTFGQYGDSITITMAFWTPLSFGQYKGLTPEMQQALETARQYVHKPCWRQWKGGEWGNTGNMTISWAFANVDSWQKKMDPEVAVILFGTNDFGSGPHPPLYTEQYAAVVDRCLADGTIPIITTLPAHGGQKGSLPGLIRVLDLRQAAIAVAKAKKVPLIDFYTEIVKRQPEKWREILIPDGLHPSYPKEYQQDCTEEGLSQSGYTLRNYLTLRTWYDIYTKVLAEKPKVGE